MSGTLIPHQEIDAVMERYERLVHHGLMDRDYATRLVASDKLRCRPCDIEIFDRCESYVHVWVSP